ncbi:hypothetical protein ES708_33039 [subsurface metagenome]
MEGAFSASTPTILISDFNCFAAKETPDMPPPPPMGQIIICACGTSSKISNPILPLPAIISKSLKLGIYT